MKAETPLRRNKNFTPRLVLRPYTLRDYPAWRKAYVDRLPALDRWDLDPQPPERCSPERFREMLARHRDLARNDGTYVYGVFVRRSGVLVGVVDVHILCREDRQHGELGYQIHNRHRRRGYGVEAARAALEIGFLQLGLNRIEACIDPENTASIALARALGMRGGGLKQAYLFENGVWKDQIVFVAEPPDLGLIRPIPAPTSERR